MPIAVLADEHRVDVIASGDVTQAERLSALVRCVEQLRAQPSSGVLFDARDARTAPTAAEAKSLHEAAAPAAHLFTGSIAFIVREGVQYGMGRMLQAFLARHSIQLEVFTDRRLAAAWLAGRPASRRSA